MVRYGLGAGLLLSVSWASVAAAQDLAPDLTQSDFARDRNVGVLERPRPDYDALGLRTGGFLIYPKLDLSETYESNVFATETGARSDFITSLEPSVTAQSQWSRHELNFMADADLFEYARFNDESEASYLVGSSGRFDIVRGSYLTAKVDYSHLIDPRSDASTPQDAEKPITYDQVHVDVGAVREVNRLRFSGNVIFYNYDFNDDKTTTGDPIDEHYRNENLVQEIGRADYALSPALAVFVAVQHNDRLYTNPPLPGDVNRDSSGNEGDVGVDFELTQLVRAQVQVGYLDQSYQDQRIGDTSGFGTRGNVEYYPTQLLTLKANVSRTVADTGVIGAASAFQTQGGGEFDYELLRNLIITGRAEYSSYDYQGIDRTDDYWEAHLGANYLFSRRFGFRVTYTYLDRTSSGASRGTGFTDNQLLFGLVAQY